MASTARGRWARSPTCPSCWAATAHRSRRFLGGLVVGALVGAALAGGEPARAVAGGTARADRRGPRSGPARSATIAAMVSPTDQPRFPDRARRRDPPRFVEFFAERGHTVVPERQPRAGRRPDAPVHQLRHGPVQGRADRRREARLHPRRQLPALPPCRRQAQRLRGGRAVAAPPHALRDARQLELRRLLQARGDPLGVGLPDQGPRHPRRPARRDRLHHRRPRPSVWKDEIGLPPERLVRWGDFPTGDEKNWWRMADIGPVRSVLGDPLRPRRAPHRGPGLASRTTASTARAGSRSGTSCSWSSSSTRTDR